MDGHPLIDIFITLTLLLNIYIFN